MRVLPSALVVLLLLRPLAPTEVLLASASESPSPSPPSSWFRSSRGRFFALPPPSAAAAAVSAHRVGRNFPRGGGEGAAEGTAAAAAAAGEQDSDENEKEAGTTTKDRTMKLYEVPQFTALQAAAASFLTDDKLHLRNLCSDSSRCAGLVTAHNSPLSSTHDGKIRRMILDYSRQQVTGETMELLYDLADRIGFTERRNDMRCGATVNRTEGRAALHHCLRMPRGYDYGGRNPGEGNAILREVHSVRDAVGAFTEAVRNGELRGATGRPLRNYLAVGIGGSQLGPEFVAEALRADEVASKAAEGRTLKFLANVDPVDFALCVRDLDPEETLIVVISKTFTTAETMLNAKTARDWLVNGLREAGCDDEDLAVSRHFAAVSTAVDRVRDFGIAENRIFGFWDWVGGRFSVCSAVGLVPLGLMYSHAVMERFLDGAHDVDEHFFDAPLRENIPVILGLLGVWNSTFLGYSARALLPYSQALRRLPAHIQQVDMESNGKRVHIDGAVCPLPTGEINFGEPGTNGQHSFYQLLHQGRVVPADFIGFCESQRPMKLDDEIVSNHDELMSNFFAQPDALAYGKTVNDLVAEGVPEELRPHRVFPGNRPSSSLLLTRLDAYAVGQLLAVYEHRTAVQGFLWGINSFDQWGVELGKHLAKQVRSQLYASRKSGASVQGFTSSTSALLEAYIRSTKGK